MYFNTSSKLVLEVRYLVHPWGGVTEDENSREGEDSGG
jgi:hypothetical protein